MSLLDQLERRFQHLSVPNITLYLLLGQIFCYLGWMPSPGLLEAISLIADKVLAGEVWRLFTFIFIPPASSPIFILFAWYLFYLMGTALEEHWGTFRYNIFLMVAYLATILASLITPSATLTNQFIGGSIFLAFAYLFPNFELYLFFILPVKIKWFALLTWLIYGLVFIAGGAPIRLTVLASVFNFLLFFGRDIVRNIRLGERRMRTRARTLAQESEAFHECAVCGITEKTHPNTIFRYCTRCKPTRGYCPDHFDGHNHLTEGSAS
jgi:hypothetical protein